MEYRVNEYEEYSQTLKLYQLTIEFERKFLDDKGVFEVLSHGKKNYSMSEDGELVVSDKPFGELVPGEEYKELTDKLLSHLKHKIEEIENPDQ